MVRRAPNAVFTKCKESLEDGRRYENLSWRLWFRQSHSSSKPDLEQAAQAAHLATAKYTIPHAAPPLSEPELSTDESTCSEDGESDRPMSSSSTMELERPRSHNAFAALIPSPQKEPSWDEHLMELARAKREYRTQSQSPEHDTHAAVRAALLHGVSAETHTEDAGTPMHGAPASLSTTGTVTPRAHEQRSRANSTHSQHDVEVPRDGTSPQPSAVTASPEEQDKAAETPHAPSDAPSDSDTPRAPQSPAVPSALPAIEERGEPPLQMQHRSATTTQLGSRLRRGNSGRALRSQERLAQRGKGHGASRAQVMQMLAMTNADDEPKAKAKPKKKRAPIVFTTGSDEDQSDEEEAKPQREEDEWSEVDEEEEKRQRAAERAAARRQRKEQEERERVDMFKKRPIRSMSLADLSAARRPKEAQQAPEQEPPARGLLSSIFHAPEARHAGAPPGRVGPQRRNPMSGKTLSFAAMPPRPAPGTESRNTSTPSTAADVSEARRNSTTSTPNMSRSKSAIALPMLNLTSMRSTTGRPDVQRTSSTASLLSGNSQSDEGHDDVGPERTRSSTALVRLSQLSQRRADANKEGGSEHKLASLVRSYSSRALLKDRPASRTSSQNSPSPTEGPSLEVESQGEPQDYFNLQRVPQSDDDDVLSPRQVRSMTHLPIPAPAPLQSPRTTRQNMLRDELSESLRQNLLWERQSRARLLGLGAPDGSGASTPVAPRRSVSNIGPTTRTEVHRDDEQSFHHKGW